METEGDPQEAREARPALLILFGPDGPGFLVVPLDNGGSVTIHVPKRYVRLLLVLSEAGASDSSLPRVACGWKSPGRLRQTLHEKFDEAFLNEDNTIRRYASNINAAIRRAAGRPLQDSELPIQARRGLGLRLWDAGLVVTLLSDR